MRLSSILVALVFAHAAGASAQDVGVEGRVRTRVGAEHGRRVRRFDAVTTELASEVTPRVRFGALRLDAPLDTRHLQTFGAQLSESEAGVSLESRLRASRALRLFVRAGLSLVARPDWPDLYQPEGAHSLSTRRYSHWDRELRFGVTVHPGRRHWLRASYAYELADYATDPTYDGINRPDHLTPFDGARHEVELGYHYSAQRFRVGVGAEAFMSESFFARSRDAHTGKTHAAAGGLPPNPFQELMGVAPGVDGTVYFSRTRRLRIDAGIALQARRDTFAGYYSRIGPRPSLGIGYRFASKLALSCSADLTWLRYGDASYHAGPGHPALEDGDRRYDHRAGLEAFARMPVARGIAVLLDARFVHRDTNFPDYVPGVFPISTRYPIAYRIDWDYDTFAITLGVEARSESR